MGECEGEEEERENLETRPKAATLDEVWGATNLSPILETGLRDWVQYKAERREGYKPVGLRQLLSRAQTAAAQYGDEAVVAVLSQSMAANYRGPVWDWLKDGRIQAAATPQKSKAAQELDDFYRMANDWASRG